MLLARLTLNKLTGFFFSVLELAAKKNNKKYITTRNQ